MLEASGLACVRGERTLFTDVSFALGKGTLLRVAGANGTGKTSLLRILCGLALPAHGEVRWKGGDIRALREDYWKDLVYIGHSSAVKDDLTALENLEIAAALAGRAIRNGGALAALEAFGIAQCAHLPTRVLSQGQRRRVALARLAVSKDAPLWVLDEPFNALDAGAVKFMESLVDEHVVQGGTTVLTTHQEVAIAAPMQRIELGA